MYVEGSDSDSNYLIICDASA